MAIRKLNNVNELYTTSSNFLAFYNSRLNAIITDSRYMRIPVDEQLVNLWGVFDTANVTNGRIYHLDDHIERLYRSCEMAHISPRHSAVEIENITKQLMQHVTEENYKLRFFISPSNSWLLDSFQWSDPGVFILAFQDSAFAKPQSVKEYTVDVPMKNPDLVRIKSNNYLSNCLSMILSREKGGYQGIPITPEGHIFESAMANLAIIKDGVFITSPDEWILRGTTLVITMQFLQEQGIEVVTSKIHVDEAYAADEMMLLGGDAWVAVTHLDDKVIGDGRIGKVTSMIKSFLIKDIKDS